MKKIFYRVLFLCAVCHTGISYSAKNFLQDDYERISREIKSDMERGGSGSEVLDREIVKLGKEIQRISLQKNVLREERAQSFVEWGSLRNEYNKQEKENKKEQQKLLKEFLKAFAQKKKIIGNIRGDLGEGEKNFIKESFDGEVTSDQTEEFEYEKKQKELLKKMIESDISKKCDEAEKKYFEKSKEVYEIESKEAEIEKKRAVLIEKKESLKERRWRKMSFSS